MFSNYIVDLRSNALPAGFGVSSAAAFGIILALIASFSGVIPTARAADGEHAVADFSGYWERPETPGGAAVFYPVEDGPVPVTFSEEAGEMRQGQQYLGDDTNPILLPHAAEAIRAQHETYRRGDGVWSPWALCWPAGVPLAFSMVWAVQFLQSEDEVTVIYQMGQTVRRVYLNEGHPADPKVSWYGHSIGHYEGDHTLVIDTIAQDPRALMDRFGTPKSEAMRIVERFTISADGQRLDIELNVEDPRTFMTAWSARVSYVRVPPGSAEGSQETIFAEYICPKNNRDAAGGGYPIPLATMPDF